MQTSPTSRSNTAAPQPTPLPARRSPCAQRTSDSGSEAHAPPDAWRPPWTTRVGAWYPARVGTGCSARSGGSRERRPHVRTRRLSETGCATCSAYACTYRSGPSFRRLSGPLICYAISPAGLRHQPYEKRGKRYTHPVQPQDVWSHPARIYGSVAWSMRTLEIRGLFAETGCGCTMAFASRFTSTTPNYLHVHAAPVLPSVCQALTRPSRRLAGDSRVAAAPHRLVVLRRLTRFGFLSRDPVLFVARLLKVTFCVRSPVLGARA